MDSDLGFKRVKIDKPQNEDLLSSLPDHLLHQILSKIEIKYAVQTCILSRRWNRVWATLSHLNFDATNSRRMGDFCKFVNKFLSKRNHRTDISTIRFNLRKRIRPELMKKIVNYAISHNVQEFSINSGIYTYEFPNSIIFCSQSLKRLTLNLSYWLCNSEQQSSPWELPSLTNLHLSGFNVLDLPQSFPVLTTLYLSVCKVPLMSWVLPALTSLYLDMVIFQGGKSLDLDKFVHLKNLSLRGLEMWYDVEVFTINSISLTNLTISDDSWRSMTCKLVVFAPNLSCFEYSGCSPLLLCAEDGLPSLEKVNINVDVKWKKLEEGKPVIIQQLLSMFQVLGGAKFLTLSFKSVKFLSRAVDLLEYKPSPFGNLKCLKLKEKFGSSNSTFPSQVRNYLLSSSPSARIIIEDEDGVRDYNPEVTMLPSHSSRGPNDSMVEPKSISSDNEEIVLSNKSHVFDGVDHTGEKVEDQKNARVDEEKAIDGHMNAGGDEDTIIQDRTDKGVGEVLARGDARVQADMVQYDRVKEMTKRIPVQVNALSNIQVIGDAMHGVRGLEPLATLQGGINDQAGSNWEKEMTKRIPVQVNALSNIQVIGDAMHGVRGLEPLATVQGGINDQAGSNWEKEMTKRIPVQVNALSNIQVIGDAMHGVRGLEPLATVEGGINDQAGSNWENNTFALWQGHQVYPEFVDLLHHINEKYPETFEHFSPQTEMIYTVGLNTLCTSISNFSEVYTTKVTASTISRYRCLFADLKKWGFNIDWLVNYLDTVDEVYAIENHLESAQMKVQELQSMGKMVEIQEAFKQLRTKLKAGSQTAILFPRQ